MAARKEIGTYTLQPDQIKFFLDPIREEIRNVGGSMDDLKAVIKAQHDKFTKLEGYPTSLTNRAEVEKVVATLDNLLKLAEAGKSRTDIFKELNASCGTYFKKAAEKELNAGLTPSKLGGPVDLSKLSADEKAKLRDSVEFLNAGLIPTDRGYRLEIFAQIFQNVDGSNPAQIAAALRTIGFSEAQANDIGNRLSKDPTFFRMLQSGTTFDRIQPITDKLNRAFFLSSPAEMAAFSKEMRETDPSQRSALNFVLGRWYGDIREIALKMSPTITGGDEVEIYANMLEFMSKDTAYAENLKDYKKGLNANQLTNLDIVGKYAFLKYSYPEMLKKYGSVSEFMGYLEGKNLRPIQSASELGIFAERLSALQGDDRKTINGVILSNYPNLSELAKKIDPSIGSGDACDILSKVLLALSQDQAKLAKYGNMVTLANTINSTMMKAGTQIATQLQFTMFKDVVPYMVQGNDMQYVMMDLSKIQVVTDQAIIRTNMWNHEKKAYEFGTKIVDKVIKRSESEFVERMINLALRYPDKSDPSNKYGRADPQALKQDSEIESFERRFRRFLSNYAPELLNTFQRMLDPERTKNPEDIVNSFRQLMMGNLEYLQMGKHQLYVAIETDQALFDRYLREIIPVDPRPADYTRQRISGTGMLSYKSWIDESGNKMSTVSGSQYVEYTRYAPGSSYSVYGSMNAHDTSISYLGGSKGENVYAFGGYKVNYMGEVATDGSMNSLKGYLDMYGPGKNEGNNNYYVQLDAVQGADGKFTYEANVFMKRDDQYIRVNATNKITYSADEAATIFAGYLDHTVDARTLFANGEIKGFILGLRGDRLGGAILKNKEQLSAIFATRLDNGTKIGVRAYVEKGKAEQLGVHVENLTNDKKKFYLWGVAGKENDKTVYGLDFRFKTEKQAVSIGVLNHLQQIVALGYQYNIDQKKYGNFLLDAVKMQDGKTEKWDTGLVSTVSLGSYTIDTWWYERGRAARYRYIDGSSYAYFKLREEEIVLRQSMKAGNLEGTQASLRHVGQQLDSLATLVGEKLKRAIKVYEPKDKSFEYIYGDAANVMNFTMYGAKSNYSMRAGWGETRLGDTGAGYGKVKNAEFIKVDPATKEDQIATMIGASVMSIADVNFVMGQYGRSDDPMAKKGSGWVVKGLAGSGNAEVSAGEYWWNEPVDLAKKSYQALVGTAGVEQRAKAEKSLQKFALGYGTSVTDYTQGSNLTRTAYVIVRGASTEDQKADKVTGVGLDMGLNFRRQDISGMAQQFTAGVLATTLSGYETTAGKGSGKLVNVYVNGSVDWPVVRK